MLYTFTYLLLGVAFLWIASDAVRVPGQEVNNGIAKFLAHLAVIILWPILLIVILCSVFLTRKNTKAALRVLLGIAAACAVFFLIVWYIGQKLADALLGF